MVALIDWATDDLIILVSAPVSSVSVNGRCLKNALNCGDCFMLTRCDTAGRWGGWRYHVVWVGVKGVENIVNLFLVNAGREMRSREIEAVLRGEE